MECSTCCPTPEILKFSLSAKQSKFNPLTNLQSGYAWSGNPFVTPMFSAQEKQQKFREIFLPTLMHSTFQLQHQTPELVDELASTRLKKTESKFFLCKSSLSSRTIALVTDRVTYTLSIQAVVT